MIEVYLPRVGTTQSSGWPTGILMDHVHSHCEENIVILGMSRNQDPPRITKSLAEI